MATLPPSRQEAAAALKYIKMHLKFYDDNYTQTVPQAMAQEFPGFRLIKMQARGTTSPDQRAYCYGNQGLIGILFNEGIQPNQFLSIAQNARTITNTGYGFKGLPDAYNDAADILDANSVAGFKQWATLLLSGYSLGSAIVSNLAGILLSYGMNPQQIKLRTFAGPKPGNEQLATKLNSCDGIFYRMVGDFVTLIPPDSRMIRYILSAYPNSLIDFSDELLGDCYLYRHPSAGVYLNENGTLAHAGVLTEQRSWQVAVDNGLLRFINAIDGKGDYQDIIKFHVVDYMQEAIRQYGRIALSDVPQPAPLITVNPLDPDKYLPPEMPFQENPYTVLEVIAIAQANQEAALSSPGLQQLPVFTFPGQPVQTPPNNAIYHISNGNIYDQNNVLVGPADFLSLPQNWIVSEGNIYDSMNRLVGPVNPPEATTQSTGLTPQQQAYQDQLQDYLAMRALTLGEYANEVQRELSQLSPQQRVEVQAQLYQNNWSYPPANPINGVVDGETSTVPLLPNGYIQS